MNQIIKTESKSSMGTNGKKFKMRIVNCSNPNTVENDSDDSNDEPLAAKTVNSSPN